MQAADACCTAQEKGRPRGMPFFLVRFLDGGFRCRVVAVLTPCLKDGDGNGIAQVEAAVLRPHRQADALRLGEGVADAFGKAGAFAAEDEPVARRKARVRKRMRAVRRHGVHAGDVGMLGTRETLHDSWMRIVAYS